jgi:hypothetical protein
MLEMNNDSFVGGPVHYLLTQQFLILSEFLEHQVLPLVKPSGCCDSYMYHLHFAYTVYFLFFNLCGVTFGTAATTGLFYQLRMTSDGDCGETGGMNISRGNRSTRRKPTKAPFFPQQIHMPRSDFEPGSPRWEASDYFFLFGL